MKLTQIQIPALSLFLMTATALGQMGGGMGPGDGPGHDDDSFPGWRGHELEHNVVLPHVAVGDQVTMTLVFMNMGGPQRMGWFDEDEDYTVTGTVRFFTDDGDPMLVEINGVLAGEFPLSLDASAVNYLEVSAATNGLEKGWLLIELDDEEEEHDWGSMDGHPVLRGERVMVSAYYSILDQNGTLESQVAVRPATFSRGFFHNALVPAEFRETPQGLVSTGLAVVNTSDEEALLELSLVGEDGQEVAQRSISLPAGAQLAQFVDQLFPSIPQNFRGSLELSTEAEGIVSMGLLQTGLVTTSLPTHHYGSWSQTSQ